MFYNYFCDPFRVETSPKLLPSEDGLVIPDIEVEEKFLIRSFLNV